MENKKIILLFIFLILANRFSFSVDTVSIKYLPLQVGNVWVYQYIFSNAYQNILINGKDRMKITGTQIYNGHKYFVFQLDGDPCLCQMSTYSPLLIQLNPLRIDSANGNIMVYGSSCQWQVNEHILDSLGRTHVMQFIGDTTGGYNSCNNTILMDTTQQVIFGVYRKIKGIGDPMQNGGFIRKYARDIGLVLSIQTCSFGYSCTYTLQGCVINGILYGDTGGVPVGVKPGSFELPDEFSLFQNYPNPFNPVTQIEYQIPYKEFVNLTVYNVLGNETAYLVNEEQYPGTYKVEWNASNFPSGVYFYKLQAGDFTQTRKMTLIK